MKCNLVLAFVFLSLGFAGRLHAQAPAVRFDRLSVAEGLSHNEVLTLLQDRRGFMWFGTMDGLSRYDGYTVTVYQNSPLDSTSLAGDVVFSLFEDRSGVLWVGTNGGLSRMDRATGTFTNYLPDRDAPAEPWVNDVGYLYEDRAGVLWVGTFGGGLYQMDRATGTFTHFRSDPDDSSTLSFDVVEAIHEDRSGTVWVSTMDGLNRFDRSSGTFTRFLYPTTSADLYTGSIVDFVEDAREPGVFWLSTITGLVRFTPATGAVERAIEFPYSTTLQGGPWWSMPRGIVPDPNTLGVLWVAVPRVGLYRFDTATRASVLYRHDHDNPHSLSGEPHCLFVDQTGMIWVGTNRGVNRFEPEISRFRHYVSAGGGAPSLLHRNISALYEDRSGALWVGTGEFLVGTTLSRIDPKTGAVTHWQPPPGKPAGLPDNIGINVIHGDRKDHIWIGTTPRQEAASLTWLDPAAGRFKQWRHDPEDPHGLGAGAVQAIITDRSGTLWVGTSEGWLSRLERESGTFTHFRYDPQNPDGPPGKDIRVIYEDRAGALWVGTSGGVGRFDQATGTFVNYRHDPEDPGSLSGNGVFAIHERATEPGILWISTGAALDRFDTRNGTFTHFTTREGFPKYPVVAILEDDNARLWMSTSGAGLLCFNPETGVLLQYDETNAVQARRFNVGAAFKSPRTGELFFGGVNGYNVFDPNRVQGRYSPPLVALADFKLSGRSVPVGGHSPLRRPIWETPEIRLAYDQNAVTFDYVALHYKNPARNRYAYRLDGFDQDWVMAGANRTATYTNLSPGEYVFRVKASNGEGVWNETGASVRLVILPPWWRMWWAYALYGIMLVGAAVSVDRFRQWQVIRKERQRMELREQELRAETAEAWASYLQAENKRQMQELDMARNLQLSMLPKTVPEHPVVDIAAYMKTATEVGGDYYDFDVNEDGSLTAVIGDATGHGAQAGTMVTAVKSLFVGFSGESDLVEVLSRSARALRRIGLPKLFMAMALVRVRGLTVEFVGAGMPPALIYRAASKCVERVDLKGVPLGAPGDFSYRKEARTLSPGDTIVLMSDGFPELFSEGGEMLGYERAARALDEVAGGSPAEIMEHLTSMTTAWLQGRVQNDDVTFIVMKVKAGA